jgi:hypothetical protein
MKTNFAAFLTVLFCACVTPTEYPEAPLSQDAAIQECTDGLRANVAGACVTPCHRDGDCNSPDLQCGEPLIKGDDTLGSCQAKTVQKPACLMDPFVGGVGEFRLAVWLEGNSPCAIIEGLPSTGDATDDFLFEEGYSGYGQGSGYFLVKRPIPAGTYSIKLVPADCRTHQPGAPRLNGEAVISQVRDSDRDAFWCALDTPSGDYLCDPRIEVASDGTVNGAGGFEDDYIIPEACE